MKDSTKVCQPVHPAISPRAGTGASTPIDALDSTSGLEHCGLRPGVLDSALGETGAEPRRAEEHIALPLEKFAGERGLPQGTLKPGSDLSPNSPAIQDSWQAKMFRGETLTDLERAVMNAEINAGITRKESSDSSAAREQFAGSQRGCGA